MNLNIKKLADQAGIDTEDFANAPVELYGAEQQLTQFARLIVKECATIADEEQDATIGCGYITKTKGMKIKEYFGVEL
jgi:ABC-type lipoprotein export system ATPase subunit